MKDRSRFLGVERIQVDRKVSDRGRVNKEEKQLWTYWFIFSFFLSFFLSFIVAGPGKGTAPGGTGIASPLIYHKLKAMEKEENILITVLAIV